MTQSDLDKFEKEMAESGANSQEADSDWPLRKIGNICDINPRSINDTDFIFDRIEYLEISNVADGYIVELEEYDIADAPSRAKRPVAEGQTVISTVRPRREHFVFMDDPSERLVVSTGFAVLYPKNTSEILPQYLYYAVTHPVFIDYLDANATGSAYPAVNLDIIREGVIPVPPVDTQESVVDTLGIFDAKIKKNMGEINKLKQMRNILISDVLPPDKMD